MSKLEDRLWSDLLGEPEADRALAATQPAGRRKPARRAPLAVGGLVFVGGLLAAALMLTGGSSTTPAYAVALNPDGSVTLTLNEVLGVAGANEGLEKLGVRVRIARPEAGCTATAEPIHGPGEPSAQQLMSMVEPQRTAGKGGSSTPTRSRKATRCSSPRSSQTAAGPSYTEAKRSPLSGRASACTVEPHRPANPPPSSTPDSRTARPCYRACIRLDLDPTSQCQRS